MRLITSLKRDTSLNVGVQRFDGVENSMLRISMAQLHRDMTNPERQSLRDIEVARTVLCTPEACELECQRSTESQEV